MTYRAGMDHAGAGAHRRTVFAALVVALIQVGGTHSTEHYQPGRHQLGLLGYLLLLLGPALLLARERFPLGVCLGTTAVAVAYLVVGYPYGPIFLSVVLGFVNAVLAGYRRAAWLSVGGLYLVHVLLALFTHSFRLRQEAGTLAWLLLVVLAAEVVRNRTEQRNQRRLARAEREQRIADEQRIAIARELHDVLAHSISLINIQAGVALELLDGDPEQARTALTTIKKASKDALGEVRQVLGTLRAPGPTGGPGGGPVGVGGRSGVGGPGVGGPGAGSAPRAPAPGLDRLAELVDQAGSAGLTVTLRTHGQRRPLPQGVELAAFRIVQEALTNVIRHSSARIAEADVGYGTRALVLEVRDPGPLSAAGGPRAGGSGSGLTGMRERVAALGGSVTAGPQGGGYAVHAELPIEEVL
jgi:signal transduction histidine kinase